MHAPFFRFWLKLACFMINLAFLEWYGISMQVIKEQDWNSLPKQAQEEIYDFYLFIKQRYENKIQHEQLDKSETLAFSSHSANTVEQWLDDSEDDVWK